MAMKTCETCKWWTPEPWDCPQPEDAFCHNVMGRTSKDWRCDDWEEREKVDLGPAPKRSRYLPSDEGEWE